MAKQVEIKLGGVDYRINIEADQTSRLHDVAALWEGYIKRMQSQKGMGRDQMLVLAGLMMADDLYAEQNSSVEEDGALTAFHLRMAEKIEALCDQLDARNEKDFI